MKRTRLTAAAVGTRRASPRNIARAHGPLANRLADITVAQALAVAHDHIESAAGRSDFSMLADGV